MNRENLKKELQDNESIKKCAEEFGLVGDETRMKICYLLCKHKELSVSEIADIINVSVSAVSRTLKKLRKAEIVQRRRDFRTVYYKLNDTPFTSTIKKVLNSK